MVKRVQGATTARSREPQGDVDAVDLKKERIDYGEVFDLLANAKRLINDAKTDDGQIDAQEAAEIFNTLIFDIEKIKGLQVKGKIVQIKNRYQALVAVIDKTPIVRDFLHQTYPEFFTFFTNPTTSEAVVDTVSRDVDEFELPELPLEPLDEPEYSSEALRSIEKQCGRIATEAGLFKGYMPDVQSRAEAINSGPFKERAAFVAEINEAVTIVGEKVEELEALRSRANLLLVEARTADASRRNEILREIESMPLADISAIAGASLTRVRTGVAQERQHVRAEIEELSRQLPSEKQEEGKGIVTRIESLVKNSKDVQLMNRLEQMKALAQVPESSGGDTADRAINFSEIFSLFKEARLLIKNALANDGKVDAEEATYIFNTLIPDLEKIGGASVEEKVLRVKKQYENLIKIIDSSSASAFLRRQYPLFFTFFSDYSSAAVPKIVASPEVAPVPEAAQIPDVAAGADTFFPKSDGAGDAVADVYGAVQEPGTVVDKKKERLRLPEEERTKLQSLVSDAAKYTEFSDDPRDQQGATELYSQEELDAFNAERDALRDKYSESDILEIARIIVVAQEKKIYEPGELIWNASRAFQSFFGMGALSPEEYIDEYRKLKGRETQPVLEFAANPEPAPASDVATPPRVYRRGKSAPPLVVEPAAPEPAPVPESASVSEPVPVPEAAAPEIDIREFIELRNHIDALFGQLSQRDVWRPDVQVLGDEKSLFALESDVARRNYLRTILFYSVSSQDSLLLRITQQGHDAQRVGEIFDEILRASRGLSQDQRIALYSVTPVFMEEIGEEEEEKRGERPPIVPVRRNLRTKSPVGAKRSVPDSVDVPESRTLVEVQWEEGEGSEVPRPDVEPAPSPDAQRSLSPAVIPLGSWLRNPGAPSRDSRPVQEPGPLPVATEAVNGREVSSEAEKETVFARMRGWVREKRDELVDSDVYRVHIKGEKTEAELDGSSTLSVPAMITGAVLSGALSYSGYALPVDGIRYMSQKRYVAGERDEISRAFHAAFEEHRDRLWHRESGQEDRMVYERKNELRDRIFNSRYLTEPQKQELFNKLKQVMIDFESSAKPYEERLNREVGRILDNAIRTRISEEKVLKEATNTLFMVTGAQFLRAPAYGAISLYERWNRLTREAPESKAGDRLRSVVSGGFNEWLDEFKGKRGRLAQAAAIGTAARFVGMGATVVESGVASDAIGAFLRVWENREAFYPSELSGLWQRDEGIDEIRDQLVVAPGVSAADVSEPPPAAYTRVEIPTPPQGDNLDVVSDVPAPVPSGEVIADFDGATFESASEPSRSEESISDVGSVVDAGVVMSPANIPVESLVGTDAAHNGITQALLSGVEARQDLLSAADQAAFRDDYTAGLLIRRMAAKDGLLDYWVSAEAVGKLAIVPVYENAEAHIAFLNPETGTAYSVDELKQLGWLVRARK